MRRWFLAALSPLICAGCSSLPALPDERMLPVEAVVKSVQCEMQAAVDQATKNGRRKWLLNWEAAYVFTINVTETGYVKAASNTFPIPIAPSLLTLGVGGGLTRISKRIAKVNFTPKLSDIKKYDCKNITYPYGHPFISSRIGFAEWLNRALDGVDPDRRQDQFVPKGGQPTSIGHTFDFSIDLNASVSPTFLIAPGGATLTPSGSYDRADDDILDVTFAAPKDDKQTTKGSTVAPVTVMVRLSETDIQNIADAMKKAKTAESKANTLMATQTKLLSDNGIKLESIPGGMDIMSFGKVKELSKKTKDEYKGLEKEVDAQLREQAEQEATAAYIKSKAGPRTALKTVQTTTTTVSSAPNSISAQEALTQLQLERLLSGPRSP